MITLQFTAEADAAAQRYGLLIESWRAIYRGAFNSAEFGSGGQLRGIASQAYALARTYLAAERAFLDEATNKIASEARAATGQALSVDVAAEASDRVSEHLDALCDYLQSELTIQIERDIAFLKQSIQRTRLQISLAAKAGQISERAARIQHQIGNVAGIDFFFHDRRNMKWPSRKFVRAIWRQHLLAVYNEVALMEMADRGLQIAEVSHPSPNSQFNGIRIAMSSNTSLATYAEVRNEIFHPNSDAIVIVPRS